MKISKSIQNKIIRNTQLKPILQSFYIKDGYEYLTDARFVIRKNTTEINHLQPFSTNKEVSFGDYAQFPDIEKVMNDRLKKADEYFESFDINLLIDTLTILKDNDVNKVEIKLHDGAMIMKGKLHKQPIVEAVLMALYE